MQLKQNKLPVGTKSMAKLFDLDEAEMKNWKFLLSVKDIFKDYNFEVLSKYNLISKLKDIQTLCQKEELSFYAVATERAIERIQACYS